MPNVQLDEDLFDTAQNNLFTDLMDAEENSSVELEKAVISDFEAQNEDADIAAIGAAFDEQDTDEENEFEKSEEPKFESPEYQENDQILNANDLDATEINGAEIAADQDSSDTTDRTIVFDTHVENPETFIADMIIDGAAPDEGFFVYNTADDGTEELLYVSEDRAVESHIPEYDLGDGFVLTRDEDGNNVINDIMTGEELPSFSDVINDVYQDSVEAAGAAANILASGMEQLYDRMEIDIDPVTTSSANDPITMDDLVTNTETHFEGTAASELNWDPSEFSITNENYDELMNRNDTESGMEMVGQDVAEANHIELADANEPWNMTEPDFEISENSNTDINIDTPYSLPESTDSFSDMDFVDYGGF